MKKKPTKKDLEEATRNVVEAVYNYKKIAEELPALFLNRARILRIVKMTLVMCNESEKDFWCKK